MIFFIRSVQIIEDGLNMLQADLYETERSPRFESRVVNGGGLTA